MPGGGVPNPPKECSAFTLYESTCSTGPISRVVMTDLAGCCTAAGPGSLFNHFDTNKTCLIMAGYTGTETCDGGVFGYAPNATVRIFRLHSNICWIFDIILGPFQASESSSLAQVGDADPPFPTSTTFIRTLARASPSLMWAFPRAGVTSNTTYAPPLSHLPFC